MMSFRARFGDGDVGPYHLPPLLKPDGDGSMPLSCAAHWIAANSGTIDFDPFNLPALTAAFSTAFQTLCDKFASSHVAVTGVRNGVRENISPAIFGSIRVEHPFSDHDLLLSEELFLCSHPYIDDEHWTAGFDDSLRTRWGVQWSKLMVLKSDIVKCWPFKLAATNSPGRPPKTKFIVAEHRRRILDGEAMQGLTAEAKELLYWYQIHHPNADQPSMSSIENAIRDAHKEAGLTNRGKP